MLDVIKDEDNRAGQYVLLDFDTDWLLPTSKYKHCNSN